MYEEFSTDWRRGFLNFQLEVLEEKDGDGIYKITLQRTKNANYIAKRHYGNKNTMKNAMPIQKYKKTY